MTALYLAGASMLCAGVAGFCGWRVYAEYSRKKQHRQSLVQNATSNQSSNVKYNLHQKQSLDARVLAYAEELTHRLSLGHAKPLWPAQLRMSAWFTKHSALAGVSESISLEGFWDTRVHLLIVGCFIGIVFGGMFSPELAALLACVGAIVGWRMPSQAIKKRMLLRAKELERSLPEMLDVISLGMRSGLSFDRSLELYIQHFHTMLAQAFSLAYKQWSSGLTTREEALRLIGSTYDSAVFGRVVENVVRSLHFGSSLAHSLEEVAKDARSAYKARRLEEVSKAPIKMMVPTGTLILPAMLILVLGPVLLELMGGFK